MKRYQEQVASAEFVAWREQQEARILRSLVHEPFLLHASSSALSSTQALPPFDERGAAIQQQVARSRRMVTCQSDARSFSSPQVSRELRVVRVWCRHGAGLVGCAPGCSGHFVQQRLPPQEQPPQQKG